jgi:hypothetical protein
VAVCLDPIALILVVSGRAFFTDTSFMILFKGAI